MYQWSCNKSVLTTSSHVLPVTGFIQLAVVIGLNHQDCLSFFNVIRPAIFTDIRPPGSVVL